MRWGGGELTDISERGEGVHVRIYPEVSKINRKVITNSKVMYMYMYKTNDSNI